MGRLAKYYALFRVSFFHTLRNTQALIGLALFLITCLVIFANLWEYVSENSGMPIYDRQHLLWYIGLNEWILVSIPYIEEEIAYDLHSGRLAYLLPRPISYLGSSFAEALGAFASHLLPLGVVTFAFTWWQAGMIPFDPLSFLMIVLLTIAAGIVAILFRMMIGFSAFWIHEVTPLYWLWEKLLFMFGGLMLPLASYPMWIQTVARFTPFPFILGDKSALAIHFSMSQAVTIGIILVFWMAFSAVILRILYRKGLRIVNIEGG